MQMKRHKSGSRQSPSQSRQILHSKRVNLVYIQRSTSCRRLNRANLSVFWTSTAGQERHRQLQEFRRYPKGNLFKFKNLSPIFKLKLKLSRTNLKNASHDLVQSTQTKRHKVRLASGSDLVSHANLYLFTVNASTTNNVSHVIPSNSASFAQAAHHPLPSNHEVVNLDKSEGFQIIDGMSGQLTESSPT